MTTYFQQHVHDLSIVDPSTGHTIGFVLSREKDASGKIVPQLFQLDGKALVDLYSGSSPTQISTNPEA